VARTKRGATLDEVVELAHRLSPAEQARLIEQVAPELARAQHRSPGGGRLAARPGQGPGAGALGRGDRRGAAGGLGGLRARVTLRAVADAHAVIWYLYDDPRLSPAARAAFEEAAAAGDQVGFSAIVLAEIVYLSERGRIHPDVLARPLAALDQPGAVLRELPFDRAVAVVMPTVDRRQVPDRPDRIIAATAHWHGVPLIRRDRAIRLSGRPTIW
jgi:PIN domain nuclease of toxin-antitoxin system